MGLKLLTFCILSASLCVALISAAPKPASPEYLLEKNLAEYLRHDKEMVKELEEIEHMAQLSDPIPARFKRQAEFDNQDLDGEGVVAEEQPGFIDKAAKFIVDLLQRFLKWINTDSN